MVQFRVHRNNPSLSVTCFIFGIVPVEPKQPQLCPTKTAFYGGTISHPPISFFHSPSTISRMHQRHPPGVHNPIVQEFSNLFNMRGTAFRRSRSLRNLRGFDPELLRALLSFPSKSLAPALARDKSRAPCLKTAQGTIEKGCRGNEGNLWEKFNLPGVRNDMAHRA